jgi:hypothetical protein
MRMTEREVGYMHALAEVQCEVRRMAQDPSTSSEGKLELLGVLSFLSELVDTNVLRHGRFRTADSCNENVEEREG